MTLPDKFREQDIISIAKCEYRFHPLADLTDYYKLFYQAYFGQGHFINDTEQARQLLSAEVLSSECSYLPLLQDISNGKGMYRVSTNIIKMGFIQFEEYFSLFIRLKKTENKSHVWQSEWSDILVILLQLYPWLDIKERREKCHLLSKETLLVRHSETFRLTYFPHYRVMQLTDTEKRVFKHIQEDSNEWYKSQICTQPNRIFAYRGFTYSSI